MQTDNDIGFVIHSRTYKEHGRHLELFTLQHGRVSAYLQCPKKGGTKNGAELQLFCPLSLSWKTGKSQRVIITEASLSGEQLQLTIPNIFTGMYCNELIYYLFYAKDGSVALFGNYVAVLRELASGNDYRICLRRFQISLLEALGYGINVDIDERELLQDLQYAYSLEKGFYRYEEHYAQFSIPGRELLKIKQGDLSSETVKKLLYGIFTSLLKGRPLMSRRLYSDYLRRT